MKLENGQHVTTWEEFRSFIGQIILVWLLIAGLVATIWLFVPHKKTKILTHCDNFFITFIPTAELTASDTPESLKARQEKLINDRDNIEIKNRADCLQNAIDNFNE